jgi:hypothetical protein
MKDLDPAGKLVLGKAEHEIVVVPAQGDHFIPHVLPVQNDISYQAREFPEFIDRSRPLRG